jgi:gamma-glutamyltranspeptidase / glutathione hydrolase
VVTNRKLRLILTVWLLLSLLMSAVAFLPQSTAAADPNIKYERGGFDDPAIQARWYRTDFPLPQRGNRSYIWGPEIIRKWQEPYKESPGGSRVVVYFDKARMEINLPDKDRNDPFFITNGLLVRELISGRVQAGDDTYIDKGPANQTTLTGDPWELNQTSPTFASLTNLASLNNDRPAANRVNQVVVETLDAAGNVGKNDDLKKYDVKLALFENTLKHNVPSVLLDYVLQTGNVQENGRIVTGDLIDESRDIGLPIAEPYWVRSKVGGVEKDVLVQAFERRVLTYTPTNPDGYKVEMGNVGQQYYRWRYGGDGYRWANTKVEANGGIVASANPYATEAGATILRNGGNAIDASLAVMFALGVVEPQSSGIGGGGFMMIRTKTGETVMVDTREMAPASATKDMFLGADGRPLPFATASQTGKAVGVPGAVKGANETLAKYGSKTLGDVMAPAINLAENGFITTPRFAEALSDRASQDKLKKSEASAAVFFPGGNPIGAGVLFKQPDLAKAYKLIAAQGPKAFYEDSELSRAFLKAVNDRGGNMTLDDLKKYEVKFRAALKDTYKGYEIITVAPPSSGGIAILQIMKLMETYDLAKMGHNTPDHLHLLTEASRLAFADRGKYLGDEDFVKIPKKGLLSKAYLDERRKLISMTQANKSITPGNAEQYEGAPASTSNWNGSVPTDGRETSHFVVADKDGNVVSFTNTIESAYGTGIMVPGWGILLNNELTDFDFTPGGPNEVAPGKRPRSSMTPTLVAKDGKPFLAIGSPGGATIILSVVQTIMNVIDYKMDVQQAIDAPRTYGPANPNISWETGIAKSVRDELTKRGHTMAANPAFIGSVQAILLEPNGAKTGGADWRRDGTVIGVK